MISASPELIAFLAENNEFEMADLLKITLIGGVELRYTNADTAMIVDGAVWLPWNIRVGRGRSSVGLEVSTRTLDIVPPADGTINGTPFLAAVTRGALDGATVSVYKLVMPSYGDTSLGLVERFSGRIADVDVSGASISATAKSEVELLNAPVPRNSFQSNCLNTLYDTACGITKSSRYITGVISSPQLTSVAITSATDLTLGVIRFESGVNAGVTRSIRAHVGGLVYFAVPLVSISTAGDTFIAWPGCSKPLDVCVSKFNNRANYRGFPFIPVPETAL